MKKKILLTGILVFVLVFGILFIGCDESKLNTYSIEMYFINESTYSIIANNWNAEQVINYAKAQAGTNIISDYSYNNYSLNEIKIYLKDLNFTDENINQFANYLTSTGKAWWRYITVGYQHRLLYAYKE